MIIKFTVLGEPTGKQRPKVFKKNGVSRAITPDKTVLYENLVKLSACKDGPVKRLDGEIEANIKAYYSIPKKMTRKNKELIEEDKLHPTKKPDCDNVAKIILDALNGIAYKDDSQVVKLTIEKYFSYEPRVEVEIKELNS